MKHTATTTQFVHADRDHEGNVSFKVLGCDMSEYGYTFLGIKKEVTVEFEIPDDFNFTEEEIKNLRDYQKKIQAEAQRQVVEIEERIQSMLAIEYKSAEV